MGTGTEHAQKNHKKGDSFWEGNERAESNNHTGNYLGPKRISVGRELET